MKKQRIFTKKHFAPLLILVAAFLLLAAPKVNASAASKKPGAVTGFTAKSDHDYGGIKLHIGQRTYSDYESGKTRIPIDNIMILAKFYDISMDYITGASNIQQPYPKE